MKYLLLILATMTSVSAATLPTTVPSPKPTEEALPKDLEKSSRYCFTFDKKQMFARCESGEIICYRFGKLEQCYPKPPEAPKPMPSPAVKK